MTVKEIIQQSTALQTMTCENSQSALCSVSGQNEKTAAILKRFGNEDSFLAKANPSTQVFFAEHKSIAYMGDYPTLNEINKAYGNGFAVEWMIPQIYNLTLFAGARNISEMQQEELARILVAEYSYLKISEVLLFFHLLKSGRYGKFYGSVDPMVVTCAMREFIKDRGEAISLYEKDERDKKAAEQGDTPTLTYQEWMEVKMLTAMYNSEYTVSYD